MIYALMGNTKLKKTGWLFKNIFHVCDKRRKNSQKTYSYIVMKVSKKTKVGLILRVAKETAI